MSELDSEVNVQNKTKFQSNFSGEYLNSSLVYHM